MKASALVAAALFGALAVTSGFEVASTLQAPSASAQGGLRPAENAHRVPVGPGPTNYTVQRQPAPGSCHYRWTADKQPLPDVACTPGASNPKVTPATLSSTICRSGYTASIRPSTSITGPEKVANAKSYSFRGSLRDAEYDHLISLQLGGDPNDPRNLWVQPPSPGHRPGSGVYNDKDKVENKLKAAICDGRVSLSAAQSAIANNWTTALSSLGLS